MCFSSMSTVKYIKCSIVDRSFLVLKLTASAIFIIHVISTVIDSIGTKIDTKIQVCVYTCYLHLVRKLINILLFIHRITNRSLSIYRYSTYVK